MCFNILLFLKIDQIIIKIVKGKFFTWNLIQCHYKIIFIIFMNQKTKRQIKNLKKEKKQSSKHLHSFHPLPLFLSNKTVQIDTHPTPSYNTERVGMRGW